MKTQNSLIDAAVELLLHEKKPFDLYELFDELTKGKELSDAVKSEQITKFYTDLTTSAKFVYTGDNQWDLKANQKIELWEKDGSFYKEYTKVEIPEEYKEQPKPKKPVVAVKEEPVVVVKEEPTVEVVEVVEPVAEEPVVPAVTEEKTDEVVANYEEEIFEDYDEFDEDKYNEYMDTYEDQYDD